MKQALTMHVHVENAHLQYMYIDTKSLNNTMYSDLYMNQYQHELTSFSLQYFIRNTFLLCTVFLFL